MHNEEESMLSLTFTEIMELIPTFHKARRVLHIQGKPGIAKSAAPYEYGRLINMPLQEVRPARMNPVDVTGLPKIDDEDRTIWTRPEIVSEHPRIILVEELAAAARLLQVSLYELIGDWRIGKYHIHPDSCIITTGNRPEDASHAEKMSAALRNRFVAVTMKADFDSFNKWALRSGIHPLVAGFLDSRRDLLSVFDGKKWDGKSAYPSPRSWHQLSDLMNAGLKNELLHAVASGCVGFGAATAFMGFVNSQSVGVTIQEILGDPDGALVPDDMGNAWAVASNIALTLNAENASLFCRYLKRMHSEHMAFAMKSSMGRNKDLIKIPEFKQWALANTKVFTGGR